MLEGLIGSLPLAQSGGSGNFLVTPEIGLMIWTLIAFGASVAILRKFAYPKIQENLDKRRHRHRGVDRRLRCAPRRRPTSSWRSTAPA